MSHEERPSVGVWARRTCIGFLLATCLATACQAADNPLIGSWRWDHDKTLRNMQTPAGASKAVMDSAAKAKKFVEAVKRKVGYMTVTYSDHDYLQIEYAPDGTVLTRQSGPYELLQIEKDVIE
jgi:hypothetical protein